MLREVFLGVCHFKGTVLGAVDLQVCVLRKSAPTVVVDQPLACNLVWPTLWMLFVQNLVQCDAPTANVKGNFPHFVVLALAEGTPRLARRPVQDQPGPCSACRALRPHALLVKPSARLSKLRCPKPAPLLLGVCRFLDGL